MYITVHLFQICQHRAAEIPPHKKNCQSTRLFCPYLSMYSEFCTNCFMSWVTNLQNVSTVPCQKIQHLSSQKPAWQVPKTCICLGHLTYGYTLYVWGFSKTLEDTNPGPHLFARTSVHPLEKKVTWSPSNWWFVPCEFSGVYTPED